MKRWTQRFFFFSGRGWEFPVGQVNQHKYLVRAIWGVVDEDKSIRPMETPEEVSRVEVVRAWVKAHRDDVYFEALLDEASLRRYLAPPTNTRYDDRSIPMRSVVPQVRKHSPSPPVEGKGKKPRRKEPNGSADASFQATFYSLGHSSARTKPMSPSPTPIATSSSSGG